MSEQGESVARLSKSQKKKRAAQKKKVLFSFFHCPFYILFSLSLSLPLLCDVRVLTAGIVFCVT